jgi:hypothetical protein
MTKIWALYWRDDNIKMYPHEYILGFELRNQYK